MSHEVLAGCAGLVAILLLFFTGLELPFSMILVGFVGFGYLINFDAAMHMMAKELYDTLCELQLYGLPDLYPHGPGCLCFGYGEKTL